jgi:hypothetical protein
MRIPMRMIRGFRAPTILAGLLAVYCMSAMCTPALADSFTFTATLNGASEGTPSPGTGFSSVTIDTVTKLMNIHIAFSGLLGITTASHIHCCTAVAGTGTAGVATTVPSFTGFPSGVTSGIYDHIFDMNMSSSYNPAFITASGGTVAGAFAALLGGMNDGKTYVNIHTNMFPGGEIRGFLQPVPEPSTVVLLAIGILGFIIAIRRHARA